MYPGGAYRKIDAEEAKRLISLGEEVYWDEGVGYIVYDSQALFQFKEKLNGKVKCSCNCKEKE